MPSSWYDAGFTWQSSPNSGNFSASTLFKRVFIERITPPTQALDPIADGLFGTSGSGRGYRVFANPTNIETPQTVVFNRPLANFLGPQGQNASGDPFIRMTLEKYPEDAFTPPCNNPATGSLRNPTYAVKSIRFSAFYIDNNGILQEKFVEIEEETPAPNIGTNAIWKVTTNSLDCYRITVQGRWGLMGIYIRGRQTRDLIDSECAFTMSGVGGAFPPCATVDGDYSIPFCRRVREHCNRLLVRFGRLAIRNTDFYIGSE